MGPRRPATGLGPTSSWRRCRSQSEARRFLQSARLHAVYPHLGLVDVVVRRGGEELAASDLAGVAAGGLMYGLGYPGVAPDYPAGRLAYKQASLVGAATALAMLHEARQGRPGSHACLSLQEAITSTTIHFANENMWRLRGEKPVRSGGNNSGLLQAADGGWLTFGITPNTPARWEAFGRWLQQRVGYDGLIGADFPGDVWGPEYGGDTHRALEQACAALPRDELCEEGQAWGFLVVPVNTVHDVAVDPHLRERGVFLSVDHPHLGLTIEMPRLPIRSTAYEPAPRPAPALGEHSAAVLADLAGVDRTEYARLRASGLVAGSEEAPADGHAPASSSATARRAPSDAERVETLPLEGVRVVDFCWMAAGPLTTELMANLGADVIKVESEARIDTLRLAVHPVENPTIETGAFFQDCNTDKRSITLDLSTPRWHPPRQGADPRGGCGHGELQRRRPRTAGARLRGAEAGEPSGGGRQLPGHGLPSDRRPAGGASATASSRCVGWRPTPGRPRTSRRAYCCTPTSRWPRLASPPSSRRCCSETRRVSGSTSRSHSTRQASTSSTPS